MADAKPIPRSPRTSREISAQKPRWAFWKGLLTGMALEVPVLAVTVWLVARMGVGDEAASFMSIVRLAALFAGLAALLTAGGIGRLAAYVAIEHGRRRGVIAAARAHAMASAGLVLIAAIPHGSIDFTSLTWLSLPAAGMVAGALCGAVIGAVCTTATSVGFAEVWSLTRKPSEALKSLLSPGDLVRLGTALRTRTSTLFEGIFDPAPPPPAKPAAPPDAPPAPPTDGRPEGDRKKAV